jgi:hypothetical protein
MWSFRAVVTLAALSLVVQAALAGGFLAGHFDMLALHRDGSTVAVIIGLATSVAGVLVWRPGRGPLWPAMASLVFLVVLVAETLLGYTRMLGMHVPLGVLMTAVLALLLMWVWRPRSSDVVEPTVAES